MRGQRPAAPGLRGRRRFGPAGHSPHFSGGAGWTFGTCSLCRDPREVEAACQDRCRGRPCGSCRRPSLAPRVRRAERPVGTQGSVTRAEPGLGCFVEELARRPGPARRPGCTGGAQGPRRLRTRCVGGLPGPPGHPRRPRRGTKGCPDVSANKLEGSNVLKVLIYVTRMVKQPLWSPDGERRGHLAQRVKCLGWTEGHRMGRMCAGWRGRESGWPPCRPASATSHRSTTHGPWKPPSQPSAAPRMSKRPRPPRAAGRPCLGHLLRAWSPRLPKRR